MKLSVFRLLAILMGVWFFPHSLLAQDFNSPPTARFLVEAIENAILSSELSGKIDEMPYRVGDAFEKGQVLVAFDCRAQKAQLLIENAGLKAAQMNLQNLQKLQKLGSAGKLEVALAEAEAQEAEGEVARAVLVTQLCQIKAPFAGKVVAKVARPHESLSAGTPILEILSHRELELKLVVPSIWMRWMTVGQKVDVSVDETGQRLSATIVRVGAKINPVSQTVDIYATPDKEISGLMVGMSGNATFLLNKGPTE